MKFSIIYQKAHSCMFQLVDTLQNPFQCLKAKQNNQKYLNSLKNFGFSFVIVWIYNTTSGVKKEFIKYSWHLANIFLMLRICPLIYFPAHQRWRHGKKLLTRLKENNQMQMSFKAYKPEDKPHAHLSSGLQVWHIAKGTANVCCVQ